MAPKRTHTDPMADSVRRSCTPDPQEDSQRSREGLNLPPPAPLLQTTPQKERRESMQQQQGAGDGSANLRVLIARYKFIINDIMVALQTPTNLIMIDDVIALTEDSLRGFRTTKVDSRATLRRLQSNPLPLTRREEDTPATPPPAPDTEKVAADHRAASPPPLAPADVSKPRSYMTALQGRTTVSPAKATRGASGKAQQELERRAQELTTEKVVESRDGSAVRGAERQRQADERRKELQDEKVKKIEEQTSKQLQAKQRRETAQEKLRTDTKERQESAQRRAEDAKTNVKDKAQRSNSRVDEVLLVNDLQQKNRQLKLEMKLSSEGDGLTTDQRREGASKQIKERNDSHTAEVEARQRDLSQQRAEKLVQRETQRQENLKRLEEQKKIDSDLKHQKVEEREKKVQLQQQAVQAEAEARKARTEERLSQSALHREEQREKQKQKSEKSDLKIREAKERREDASTPNAQSSAPPRATFTEVMPVLSAAEEEAVTQRLAKSQASMSRQAKTFLDNYQKESTLSAKDINKSRLRPLFGRLTVNALATSSRTALHDVATMELTDVDHEFMRHANGFETLVKLFLECRKSHDATILKLCSDVLHKFVMDSKEGHAHTKYFVRSGHLVSLIAGVYEEIKTLKKHNRSITLTTLLSLVSHCVGCVVSDVGPGAAAKDASSSSSTAGGIKLAPVRDQILTDLESIGLDRFCFAIATTCIDDDDMASLQYALLILYYHVMFLSKRKTEAAGTSWWVTTAITSLFTLLQNILTPGGLPLREKDVLSHSASCVIFTALRILSTISRWKLESIQDFLRGADVGATSTNSGNAAAPPMNSSMNSVESTASNHNMSGATRNELFHIVTSFFQYVATHDETLEHLPSASVDPATMEGSCLRSFTDALQFGMTLPSVPRTPLPTDCIAVASTSALDENSRTIQRGSFLRAGMHELLLLVGYITLGDSNSQEIFSWGKERPLLALMLSSLPMQYFAQARHILFPALLSILHRDDRNKIIASREMDLGALTQFLQEELDAVPPRLKQRAQAFHEAQELEAAMAASNKAKSPVKAQPIVAAIPKKSWIEIMNEDDDEDDFRIPSPGHPTGKHSAPAAAPSAVPAPVTTAPVEKSKALAEKERLAKAIKSMAPGLAHFRCDRRFPPSMWVDMLVFLNKPLPPPAPEL